MRQQFHQHAGWILSNFRCSSDLPAWMLTYVCRLLLVQIASAPMESRSDLVTRGPLSPAFKLRDCTDCILLRVASSCSKRFGVFLCFPLQRSLTHSLFFSNREASRPPLAWSCCRVGSPPSAPPRRPGGLERSRRALAVYPCCFLSSCCTPGCVYDAASSLRFSFRFAPLDDCVLDSSSRARVLPS